MFRSTLVKHFHAYVRHIAVAKKGTIQGYSVIGQASIQTNKTKTPYEEKFGY